MVGNSAYPEKPCIHNISIVQIPSHLIPEDEIHERQWSVTALPGRMVAEDRLRRYEGLDSSI